MDKVIQVTSLDDRLVILSESGRLFYQGTNADGWSEISLPSELNANSELAEPSGNQIMVIQPYLDSGTWVFDDPSVDLVKEPFVEGIPEMIASLVSEIPEAENGFRLLFSASPFPGYQRELLRNNSVSGGYYYTISGDSDEPEHEGVDAQMTGWICPAIFRYFTEAPQQVYVRAESASS